MFLLHDEIWRGVALNDKTILKTFHVSVYGEPSMSVTIEQCVGIRVFRFFPKTNFYNFLIIAIWMEYA